MAAGNIGKFFTGYGTYVGGVAAVVFSGIGAASAGITLPQAPSGTGGFVIPIATSGQFSGTITAVSTTGCGIGNQAAGSGYVYAFVPHSVQG